MFRGRAADMTFLRASAVVPLSESAVGIAAFAAKPFAALVIAENSRCNVWNIFGEPAVWPGAGG
ncbi:hypothetical protein MAXJ12_03018 [Mesorhizobium alhagi CCNWXJ12-2]|uniref:Uncharacterized protein n=1 Tax=Mesorhizobium alhagi CCNWXJ12-2 TaxID=1107882 RepID=H0HKE8_9HYPH|nr:hypothetical protein MAXJ12_03018 [Mesorhizobium alhagi CCNWXJ12-2]